VRVGITVLVLVAACRLRFDEVGGQGDAETGHDEDQDGIADVVDPCPHVAGNAADSDGDGVGDVCDPEPSSPRQHWELFDPLTSDSAYTQIGGTWTHTGDSLRCDTSTAYGQLRRDVAFHLGVYEVGVDIVSRNPVAERYQVATAVLTSQTQPHYYVEVYEMLPAQYASVSMFDGAVFAPIVRTTLANGVHTGSVALRFVAEPSTPSVTVGAAWPGESYSQSQSAPDYSGGTRIDVRAVGLVLELRYIAVIATR
jgi:hypothetical protein